MNIDDRGWLVGSKIGFFFGVVFGLTGGVVALVSYAGTVVWFGLSVLLLVAAWMMKP